MKSFNINELVQGAQQRDDEAFKELVLRLQYELQQFISARAASYEMIEETLQATFVVCYEKIGQFTFRGSFAGWLKTIAAGILRSELTERARQIAMEGDALERVMVHRAIADFESKQESVQRSEEAHRKLDECLDELTPRVRKLLARRYEDRLSLNRIAQQFKKPAAWVANTLCRARQKLKRCLEAGGMPA